MSLEKMNRHTHIIYDGEENRYTPLESDRASKCARVAYPTASKKCAEPVTGPPHLWEIVMNAILPDLMIREPEKLMNMFTQNANIRAKLAQSIATHADTRQVVLPIAAASEKIKDVGVVGEDEIVELMFPEYKVATMFNGPERTQILKMKFGDLPYKLQASIQYLMGNAANPVPCTRTMYCPTTESIAFNAQRSCLSCQKNMQVPEMTLDQIPVIPVNTTHYHQRHRPNDFWRQFEQIRDKPGNVQAAYIEEVKKCAFDNDITPSSSREDGTDWVAIPDTLLWDAHEYVHHSEEPLIEQFDYDMVEFFKLDELHDALVKTGKIITNAPDEVWVQKPRLRLDVYI